MCVCVFIKECSFRANSVFPWIIAQNTMFQTGTLCSYVLGSVGIDIW